MCVQNKAYCSLLTIQDGIAGLLGILVCKDHDILLTAENVGHDCWTDE